MVFCVIRSPRVVVLVNVMSRLFVGLYFSLFLSFVRSLLC